MAKDEQIRVIMFVFVFQRQAVHQKFSISLILLLLHFPEKRFAS